MKTLKALKSRYDNEEGFALAELMVAISIILIILVSSAYVIIETLKVQVSNENRNQGVQLVRGALDTARTMDHSSLGLNPSAVGYRAVTPDGQTTVEYTGENAILPVQDTTSAGVDYTIRTDITWYFPADAITPASLDNLPCYTAKRIRVEAVWYERGEEKMTSMSWVRTPTVGECSPPIVTPAAEEEETVTP